MGRLRFFGREEVEIKLRLGRPRPERPLVPWWVRAMRRVGAARTARHQGKGSLNRRGAKGRARMPERLYGRRSVVKASFRRNLHKASWARHARYLARDRAQREDGKGLGFDATRADIDMVAVVRDWERSDELMWSFIISPEDGSRIDLHEHARGLVAGMARDLGTRLEWVAIDHHNTDDAHVHLLVRGVRDDGRTLKIDGDYLRRGIREQSQDLVERELGPRLEREVLQARERVIRREQWTEIDRAFQRKTDGAGVVSYEQFQPRGEAGRIRAEQEIERLQFLEGMGLARRVGEREWQLSPEHERELRGRQQAKDIIKSRARDRQREGNRTQGFERERDRDG